MLENFGKLLITEVRDSVVEDYKMIKSGQMKSKVAGELHKLISSFDDKEIEVLDQLTDEIIDRMLHKFLFLFEESKEFTIAIKNASSPNVDLVKESDGISGELFGKRGWISKFSKNQIINKKD